MRLILLIFIALGSFHTETIAQIYNPVKWSYSAKNIGGDKFELTYSAAIEDGWSIYSQYLESDDGPIRTSFEYEDAGTHFVLEGKNEESGGRKEAHDKIFDMTLIKFKKEGFFKQVVEIKDYSKPIVGFLEYMTCDDSKCLPPKTVDFEFKLDKPAAKPTTPKTGEVKKKEEVKEQIQQAPVKIEKAVTQAPAPKEPVKTVQKKAPVAKPAKDITAKGSDDQNKIKSGSGSGKIKVDLGKVDNSTSISFNDNFQNDSGILDPVKWTGKVKSLSGENYQIQFKADIEDKWSIYSQYLESEDGPNPTVFTFNDSDNIKLAGKNEESGGYEKGYDPVFEMNVAKFKHNAIFSQKITVKDPAQSITGFLEFMACDESKCLPPKFVDFKIIPSKNIFILGPEAAEDFVVASAAGSSTANIVGNEIDQVIPGIQNTYKAPLGDCGEEDVATGSLWWTFFLGFIGGLIALLTPCVWPMIPLTVSFFTKGSKDKASGLKNGIAYAISIVVIYVGLGSLINAVFGPTALNALSTNWIANLFFFAMFVAFAISFFGYFEITLPSSWANKSDAMAEKGGYLGTFFMAATLSLVSFSCTGPIIGSALVTSATNPIGPIIVMLGFSMALALPFGFFAAFPAWLNSLPKSGSWMTSVKVVLGFVELALALKFLSIADMTMHWGLLKYETFMILWIILALATAAYLFGLFRFPHDSKLTKLSPVRGSFGILFLAFAIYLGTGFMQNDRTGQYNAKALMSGLAPPASYNLFLGKGELDNSILESYSTYTKCANNLNCFKDYYEGMSFAKKNNLPVLLDFTGYGCVNCRKTEEHIWVDETVWDKLNNEFVLISLYVDDRENLDQTLVSKNTNEKLRNVGNKWADFQIVNFRQNSQPLYVMVTPDEQVIAAPRGYKEGIDGYLDFLECGLATFNGLRKEGKLGMK